ncbi:MAG: PAS domain-containing protein [Eubacteriales bacterium]|nr:PAS domain-containing protein [Eubacteriales bacterium]
MHSQSFAGVDVQRMEDLIHIKAAFLKGEISMEEAKNKIVEKYPSISPEEFAYTEQRLKDLGFTDEKVHENMDELIGLLDGVLTKNSLQLPIGHPIRTYLEENTAIKNLLGQMDAEAERAYQQQNWKSLTDKLYQFNIHLSRKQNQLFSKLEEKGFDRPSKIMWSFDNDVKKAIRQLCDAVQEGKDKNEVLALYQVMREALLDLLDKEESILYPTSVKLISDIEFAEMRVSDDEIGYCLIEVPAPYIVEKSETMQAEESNEFMKDFMALAAKYQIGKNQGKEVLDVKQGKLTLEQINLIYQHMPMDFSFVDENELVQFYTDTAHRIFPRSAGVIGRNVMNCHPRESLDVVKEIIEAFRSGRQDKAEFWLEMGDKFIYILYTAVRDKDGKFRGVLEMMQDVAHIRSLQGQRRLLNWDSEDKAVSEKAEHEMENKPKLEEKARQAENPFGLKAESIIYDVIKEYPFIREFMPSISPKYEKLLNPIAFNTIAKMATLEMVAQRGDLEVNDLIAKMTEKIKNTLDR